MVFFYRMYALLNGVNCAMTIPNSVRFHYSRTADMVESGFLSNHCSTNA